MTSVLKAVIRRIGLEGFRSYRQLLAEIKEIDPSASLVGSVFYVGELQVDAKSEHWMLAVLPVYAKHRDRMIVRKVDGQLEVEFSGLTFRVRSVMEFSILEEIFFGSIYRFKTPAEAVVIDIGANIGASVCYFAKILGLRVYGYELVPEIANRAQAHVVANGLENLATIQAAGIAERAGEIEVNFDTALSGATTMYLDTRESPTRKMVACKLLSVHNEFSRIYEAHPDQPVIVKLDCEGAEYEIMATLIETGLIKRVSGFLMEYHNVSPEKNGQLLESLLTQNGFAVHGRVIPGQEYEMLYAFRIN